MAGGVLRSINSIMVAVGVLIFLLIGVVKESSAARKCKFNGVTYVLGDTVVSFPEACAAIECQAKTMKNAKQSQRQVELVVATQDLSSCTCNLGSRSTTDLRTFKIVEQNPGRFDNRGKRDVPYPFGGQSRIVRGTIEKEKPSSSNDRAPRFADGNRPGHRRQGGQGGGRGRGGSKGHGREGGKGHGREGGKGHGRKGDKGRGLERGRGQNYIVYPGKRQKAGGERGSKVKRGRKTCKFNNQKFTTGQTVYSEPLRCLELMCVQESNKVSVIKAQYTPSCSCTDPDPSPSAIPSPPGVSDPSPSASPSPPGPSVPNPPPSPTSGTGGLPAGSAVLPKCSDYSSINAQHSACKAKSTTCIPIRESVTEDEKKVILKAHNDYRAMVANGKENRGSPGPQPSAANMRELVWNDELAQIAQAWAFTCPTGHDCSDCRKITGRNYYVGQNLYWSWNFSPSEEWNDAITAFYEEVAYVPNTLVANYQPIFTSSQIGHYTQLVWAETNEIGCGAIYYGPCSAGLVSYQWCKAYACNYGSGGNIIGNKMYEQGPAASNCANGKSDTYDGLCK